MKKKSKCYFCQKGIKHIDYKDVETLKMFITERGSIRSARSTGTCPKHQRALARAIKRARIMGLLPFVDRSLK